MCEIPGRETDLLIENAEKATPLALCRMKPLDFDQLQIPSISLDSLISRTYFVFLWPFWPLRVKRASFDPL